ncbi:kynurenine formamidase [Marinithermofilum abyssi]|uniref:Kynurenine formamidase n=1 Tax=Marinithermofilum abyssi TaxID=1571185 RepID=A0A8J2YEK6_9BACL|nr:arylformamidase [Marinithermofilum abyssi]GGE25496.1 kynurenine formamidase [Marinithermofilum abyssi]
MSEWIDISLPLSAETPVWPGDTPFSYRLTWTKAESGSVNVGQITLSTHTGTHIDAPYHFDDEGKRVLDLDVHLYIGPARVIQWEGEGSIRPKDLAAMDLTGVKRLLIRTGAWSDPCRFPKTIPHIEPELAPFLAEKGVRLLGLDLPSVDPLDSKELPAHHALHRRGIHILESAVLDQVEPGEYELVALPLPLKEADGSPVRAVLKRIG